ncbi:endonuclease/exonuclease/phosphatase family protein [Pontibacter sp. 172403-2]|uniref:endonuclease/exonuclease/phosphatase family protein n=1 Tax=Pontibacter rufus TaxID=2791028 RepID=UPI0018AFC809|nr:endonuclease/exonuclease/phosphatase family protein [Pontibacter sp. 172403-2]MBF9253795.1 endonuclease/exonuclease/phosphatase family protein [Pontibacter sp. 172403-2]
MHHGIKTLSLLFTIIILSTGCSRLPLSSSGKGKPQTIVFYDTENLYDTANDPATAGDNAYTPDGRLEWTQEKYEQKIKNIAAVLKATGGGNGPELIGLSGIENKKVLQDLVSSEALRKSKYSIIHYDMAGGRALDVALLYKPKAFKPTAQQSIKINNGGAADAPGEILQVNGELQGFPVTIFVTQWPARARGRQGDNEQRAAAATLRKEIAALQAADKDARILVLGDFGANPDTNVMQKVLKATGRPNPYYYQELFNTFYVPYVSGMGSYYSRGDFRMPDQILISKSLVNGRGLEYVRGSAIIHNPEKIKFLYGKYKNTPLPTFSGTTYFGGYSDHFPVYIQVRKVK